MSDLYDNEVHTLLKMGGQKALENQYKNISRRLDNISDENKVLKQRIAELENSETENTVEVKVLATPIEIATYLINNTCTINELKMIAEHINVYCNGGK